MHTILLAAVLVVVIPVGSQSSPAGEHVDASVVLRIASQSQTFHIGELIPLQMVFTSDRPNYAAVTVREDKYGRRIDKDQFHLEPGTGFSDPLQPYLNVLPEGGFGVPFFSSQLTVGEPQSLDFDLNQWLRFDKPGHYRPFITTSRVSEFCADGTWNRSVPLVTNAVEFEIVGADVEWQKDQLRDIVQDLRSAMARSDVGELSWIARRALARLRYLDTPESTRQLAREMSSESAIIDRECLLGLLTSKSRDTAIEEVNRLIADPEFPVSDRLLDALCWLTIQPPVGRWPYAANDYKEAMAAARQQLQQHIMGKTGYGLAVSLDTLIGSNPPRRLSEKVDPASINILIQTFLLLPSERQAVWLSQQWPRVSGSRWIPTLARIATRHIDVHFPIDTVTSNALGLPLLALRRWYDIDPAGARPTVISAIMRADQPYTANDLNFLSEKTLPDTQTRIAENLKATKDPYIERNVSSLLVRYADDAPANEILAGLDSAPDSLDCVAQVNIAAWLLKVGDPRASTVLHRALSCDELAFTGLGSMLDKNDVVEQLAISHLNDSNLMVVIDALRYIRDHGTIISKQPVWNRLNRWNEQWGYRMDELKRVSMFNDPRSRDRDLGMELPQVLAHARGWLLDETERTRLKQESLQEDGRREVGPVSTMQAKAVHCTSRTPGQPPATCLDWVAIT